MKRARVGVIGAGNISDQYLTNLSRYPDVELVAIADANPAAAAAQAARYGIARHGRSEVVLDDPTIGFVVNLTVPVAHAEVTEAALRAGKHVWSEKPLAMDRESGRALLDLAAELGLRIGCAPDTVLCPGVQGSLAALRELEATGSPAFRARMLFQYHGPDTWHPNPEFLFKPGAGPLMDYGPYYLTDAVLALGTVSRVVGSIGVAPRAVRQVETGPLAGTEFTVEVPTTVVALLQHAGGAVTDITFSFDANTLHEEVEFLTPQASVVATDPNIQGGTVRVMKRNRPVAERVTDDPAWGRGVGLVDLIRSIDAGVPHRASGDLAYHVLDVMLSIAESAASGTSVDVASAAPVVPLIPEGWRPDLPLG